MNGSHKDFIRTSRQILGLTQKGLAEALCVSQKAVESWEYGKRNPSKQVLMLIDRMVANG